MNNKDNEKIIRLFANAIKDTNGVLLSIYDVRGRRFKKLPTCGLNIELLFTREKIQDRMEEVVKLGEPLQISNEVNCFWIAVPAKSSGSDIVYILGPVLIAAVSREQIIGHYYKKRLSAIDAGAIADEYARVPIVSYQMLINLYSLLYHLIYGTKADITALGLPKELTHLFEIKMSEEDIYNMQRRVFKNEIEAEKLLCEGIRNGDTDMLGKKMTAIAVEFANLGPDELRTCKNTMIVAIALITRAAVSGGLPVEIAFPLSDYYILQIEQSKDMAAVTTIQRRAVIDFASRVKNNQFKLKYSQLINRCCGHIVANVHRRVTVSELAGKEYLHPDTLMRRFKQETGMTVVEYTRHIKMKEAKTLLKFSDKQIADIAFLLGYSSQSQFISSFKQEHGMTPSAYRQKSTE